MSRGMIQGLMKNCKTSFIDFGKYRNVPLDGTAVHICGEPLFPNHVAAVSRTYAPVTLGDTTAAAKCQRFVERARTGETIIYGVNTNYGGLASTKEQDVACKERQDNFVWALSTMQGNLIPTDMVRGAMSLRINSLIQGRSGCTVGLLERTATCLNEGITPLVAEHGSIGASGDLVPLAQALGSIAGCGDKWKVTEKDGRVRSSLEALADRKLGKLELGCKDSIAFCNGTSFSLGIGMLALYDSVRSANLALACTGLVFNAMHGTLECFDDFVGESRKCESHIALSRKMMRYLGSSTLLPPTVRDSQRYKGKDLVQDRYPLRAMPAYYSPLLTKLARVEEDFIQESCSVSDNPLIDYQTEKVYSNGNFLASIPTMGCDDIRYCLALITKHIDVLVGYLHETTFSHGLPACLLTSDDGVSLGLKGLQLTLNSIAGKILYNSHPVWPLYSTHSEQYNQAINTLGFQSALLAAESARYTKAFLANALIHIIQACELRTYQMYNDCKADNYISEGLVPLYQAVYDVLGKKPHGKSFLTNKNYDQLYQEYLYLLEDDLNKPQSKIYGSLEY